MCLYVYCMFVAADKAGRPRIAAEGSAGAPWLFKGMSPPLSGDPPAACQSEHREQAIYGHRQMGGWPPAPEISQSAILVSYPSHPSSSL